MKKRKNEDDKMLAQALKNIQPKAQESHWFARKVLNRLPPRRHPVSRLETAAYIIGFIAIAVFACRISVDIAGSRVITVGNILEYLAVAAGSVALLWSAISSRLADGE